MSYDPKLGKEIHEMLVRRGLETPMIDRVTKDIYYSTDDYKKEVIEKSVREIMSVLNLDMSNDSLKDTPRRIAKMYVDEVFSGLNYDHFPKIMSFENSFQNAGMVVERGIKVNSACSHHFVPTIGIATVGYIPNQRVLGLSKLNRIVDFFARRPQEQERFVEQVHATLCHLLESVDVAVFIEASHYCVKWRGVENENASMVTSKISGAFKSDSALRSEFYSLAR